MAEPRPSQRIHVVVTYDIKPDKYDAWLKAVKPMAIKTNQEKGCIRYNVHADKKNKFKIVMVEEWDCQRNLTTHLKQEHVKTFNKLQREKGMVKSAPKIYFCGEPLVKVDQYKN
eukprot:412709_1